jgi:hypothetical protein|eukprot:SAG25_NODE_191_length_12265_cov_16.310538_11_plen_97_part_00
MAGTAHHESVSLTAAVDASCVVGVVRVTSPAAISVPVAGRISTALAACTVHYRLRVRGETTGWIIIKPTEISRRVRIFVVALSPPAPVIHHPRGGD